MPENESESGIETQAQAGPWGERPVHPGGPSDDSASSPPREPFLTAPWPALVIVAVILISYAWQSTLGGGDAAAARLGFAPTDLVDGRWWTVVTVGFVHGGWTHAIMNAVGALAFGPPVARLMGRAPMGVLTFFALYLVCGALSCLGYAALHIGDPSPVVGASGAISGLMGAAARLMGGGGAILPLRSRPVISFGLSWVIVNALLAVVGGAPLMPGARIAWEAHIAGFVAGALLVGVFSRLSQGFKIAPK